MVGKFNRSTTWPQWLAREGGATACRDPPMPALFIGQTYIAVTFLTDHFPTGDVKTVAPDYAVSFGGNAVSGGLLLRQAWERAGRRKVGGTFSFRTRGLHPFGAVPRHRSFAAILADIARAQHAFREAA